MIDNNTEIENIEHTEESIEEANSMNANLTSTQEETEQTSMPNETLQDEPHFKAASLNNDQQSVYYSTTKSKPLKTIIELTIPKVMALSVTCSILGGLLVGGIFTFTNKSNQPSNEPSTNQVEVSNTVLGSSSDTLIEDAPVKSIPDKVTSSTAIMSATDIYNKLAINQVVGVTTEVTYTNIWGYTTSGAVSGSGFIISSDGYILTNHHVIEDALKGDYQVKVVLYDGSEYEAKIIGYEDDGNDIAVLKIDADNLTPVTFGDSELIAVGEVAYAVGNPLGELQFSMSTGSISALDRVISFSDGSSINMFQIDAAVNSGNSGGPVYNNKGEVIGVVTAKYANTGVEGLGFAIPINDAVSIATDLIETGYVKGKPSIGILNASYLDENSARYYGIVPGVYFQDIQKDSAAEKAGLQVGDIIVKLGDYDISSLQDLIQAKRKFKAGDTTTIRVYRSGDYIDLDITLDEQESEVNTDVETLPDQNQQYTYDQFDQFFNNFGFPW